MLIAEFFLWTWAKNGIASFFTGILLFLDSIVYSLISWIYQIIMLLCSGDILNNVNAVDNLVERLYAIIGVIMLFIVAYSLLKAMVNPDELTKGKQSPVTIIKNVIISISLIAIIPTVFDFALGFQQAILTQGTIGKLILGTTDAGEASKNENVITQGGNFMASTVLGGFLHPNISNGTYSLNPDGTYNATDLKISDDTDNFNDWWDKTVNSGNFLRITELNEFIGDGQITYYYVVSTISGVFVIFVLLSYCLDIALRLVKLAVFQLMAPLPILARIMPNEQASKVFSNWLKATISTYVEVFIRLAILFFCIFIMKVFSDNILNIFPKYAEGASPELVLIANVLVVIGIIMFAKQAPEIIKEVTGLDGGKYSKSLMRGIGMMTTVLGGGATAAIRSVASDKGKPLINRVLRALGAAGGAAGRGLWHGSKVNKFGDIPKAAGTAASNTLSKRGTIEAAGGQLKYRTQQFTDAVASVKDWAGGTADDLKNLKKVNDNLLKQIGAIKNVAEDYIDKHAHEYFKDEAVQNSYNDLNRKIKEAEERKAQGDTTADADLAQYESDLATLNSHYASQRLDILKVKSEDVNLSAEDRAMYIQEYNKTRKAMVDGFASTAKTHVGAEKEAAQVDAIATTIGKLVKENRSATAIQYATTAAGKAKHDDIDTITEAELQTDPAKFIKNLKKATEYADIDIQAELDEVNRREERRKSGGGSDN